jgi:D-glycero-D-manno-heptose 1,7-bisphosphate phosphatase
MSKAVFLDRDGVLIRERGDYNYMPEHFIINEGVAEAVKMLTDKNFLLIGVTNQSGVAKRIYSHETVRLFHEKLSEELGRSGIIFSEFYYCPHTPDISLCLCRKPLSLMLEKAIARFRINPVESFLIGDAQRDIDAAQSAGVKSFLIKSNQNLVEIARQIAG